MGCASSPKYWSYKTVPAPSHINHVTEIPVWIDSNFSKTQVSEINKAIAEWNMVFNGQVIVKVESTFKSVAEAETKLEEAFKTGLGILIINLPESNPLLGNLIDDSDGVLAFVRGPGGHLMTVIGDHVGNRNLKTIVLHEMGHLFGCYHVNIPNSLILPFYSNDQANCVDKISAAQAAGYLGLNLNTLNYCVTPNFE